MSGFIYEITEMMSHAGRSKVLNSLPPRWRVPATFHVNKWRGTLEREIQLVRRFKKSGTTSVDVGADHGLYTYEMARIPGATIAIEPNPQSAARLRSLARPGVEVIEAAAGSIRGRGILKVPILKSGRKAHALGRVEVNSSEWDEVTSVQQTDVSVLRLDDLELDDVSLIKIDVEGSELDVLEGALGTMARFRPFLIVEIEDRHGQSGAPLAERIARFESIGYTAFFVRPSDRVFQRFEPDVSVGTPDMPGYVNNFVFFPTKDSSF